jgi:Ca2+-binding EF-hand superfamily protein
LETEDDEELEDGKNSPSEPLDFAAFINTMNERSQPIDASEHITEQFLMFAGQDPDSYQDSAYIT